VQPAHIKVEAQGRVTDDLVEVAHREVIVADMAKRRPRRGIDIEAGVFAELADAEEVGPVGDDDDVAQVIFVRDSGEPVNLLFGIDGAGLSDDAAERNPICKKVVAADAPFGVAGVLVAAAAEGDNQRSDLLVVELNGVIEACMKHRRRMTGVFGCTEYSDCVGRLGVVLAGNCGYLLIDPDAPCGDDEQKQPEQPAEEETAGWAPASQIGGRSNHRG